jgi:hypothetical protein
MKSLLEQLHRIENLLIDRTMQVAEGSIALADRHHVAVTFQAAFLDSIVELDRLAFELGNGIRDKARLHGPAVPYVQEIAAKPSAAPEMDKLKDKQFAEAGMVAPGRPTDLSR